MMMRVLLFVFVTLGDHQALSFSPVRVISTLRNTGTNTNRPSRRGGPAVVSNLNFAPATAEEEDVLQRIQIPDGLRETLYSNLDTMSKRFWIVDNSGSMAMQDGVCQILSGGESGHDESCSRWNEVQQTVFCHAQLSAALAAPTEFRLLNPPKGLLGGSKKFRVGFCDNKRGITRDLKRAQSIMSKNKPSGMTSIPSTIAQIRNEIVGMLPQLEAEDSKVAIIIATDGSNYNKKNIGQGNDEDELQEEMIKALESLQGLPVYVVVRLCTDYEPLVSFYNNLDSKLDINLDVLDDYHHEAKEVYMYNKWLNYAMVLHRMREMGQQNELFDLLDERPFTKEEIRDFCILLFGKEAADPLIPDPEEDWMGFIAEIDCLQLKERMQLNPMTLKHEPWLNIQELAQLQ